MFEFLKHSFYSLVIFPGFACILSLLLTRLCISVLPRVGFMDLPDARRVHQKPTPRGGGIAIITAFFLTSLIYVEWHSMPQQANFVFGFAIPATVIAAGGLLDDRFALSSWTKLSIQVLAGILVWVVGARMKYVLAIELPDAVALPLTILWVVTIVNAFNLIDGMDGVAAGLGTLSSICLGIWGGMFNSASGQMAIAFVMAGSCAGFLRYNFSPARIFMGDTGSMFLGLFFAYAGLASFGKPVTLTALLIPMLAIGVPLFDVTLAFWRRLVRKFLEPNASGIMTADLHHLHHRILREVNNQRKAAIRIYLLACLLALAGFAVLLFEQTLPALGYIALLLIVLMVIRRVAQVELYDSARLLKNGFTRPRKLRIVLLAVPVADILILFGADLIARNLLGLGFLNFWKGFLCLSLPTLLLLLLSGSYRILWLRMGFGDLRRTAEFVLGGLLLGCILFTLFALESRMVRLPAFLVLFSLLVILGCGLIRIFLINIGIRMMWSLRQGGMPSSQKVRVLLYGGGLNAMLYLNHVYGNSSSENLTFVGIVDDDRALAGMKISGLPVLGTGEELEEVLLAHKVNRIVITMRTPTEQTIALIRKISRGTDVSVHRFQPEEVCIDTETDEKTTASENVFEGTSGV